MHQNNLQHFFSQNFVKNEAESQAVFAVSYVCNLRGRAMLLGLTVNAIFRFSTRTFIPQHTHLQRQCVT